MPQPPEAAVSTDSAAAPAGAPQVLLAVANPVQQFLVGELLQRAGCGVSLASSAAQAWATAQVLTPALVLWDTCLPGMALAQAVRGLRGLPGLARTPVVALSAGPAARERRTWLQAGCDDHLAQPVEPAQLAALLMQWLPRALPAAPAAEAVAEPPSESPSAADADGPPGLDMAAGLRFLGGNEKLYRQSLLTFAGMHGAGLQASAGDPVALRREAHALGGAAAVLGATEVLRLARALQACIDSAAGTEAVLLARASLQLKLQALALDIHRWAQNTA